MLKILRTIPFFSPAFGFGGPVIHSLNISKIQASLGYDVRVFTSNILTNDLISKDLPRYEVLDDVKIHRFPIKYRLGNSHYFITPSIISGFLKYNYDIIHSHSFRTFQTDISIIYSKLKRKPFVFTAHGTLRNISLFNWLVNKKKESKRVKLYDLMLKKIFINTVDRVIVHSEYEKFWTLKNNIPEDIIRVIPHGINLENFSNKIHRKNFLKKFKIKDKMILYVGRLLKDYRNLDHLIIVMNEIIKVVKDVKLWFVGYSFDKSYKNELIQMIKKRNLINHVRFITQPTREDIIGAYLSANVVVFPITDSDSFGIPLLEAGAAKCPVISTNRGPAPELIKNGKTGILTEPNNLNKLKEALLRILSDTELQQKLGQKGYENVVKNYTWKVITKKINEVYDEVV